VKPQVNEPEETEHAKRAIAQNPARRCPKSRPSGYRTARGSERDKNSISLTGGGAILADQRRNKFGFQLESLSRSLPRAVLYQPFVGFKQTQNCLLGQSPAVVSGRRVVRGI